MRTEYSVTTGLASPGPQPSHASLKFGTSGLRGLVIDLVGLNSRAYALAFVRHMQRCRPDGVRQVLIGRDLRSSSPAIANDCAAAVKFAGLNAIDCGELPTPALALEAQRSGSPAIMVTGSHIPDDRNGLKFYRPDGEISKADEIAILAEYCGIGQQQLADLADAAAEPVTIGVAALTNYVERYRSFFGSGALLGMRIGVYQHSSVARDALMDMLAALGALPVALGRSSHFIPVDTEAQDDEQRTMIEFWAKEGGYFAIVSTDGDADRPMVADERGRLIRGDVLGLLSAQFLDFDTIVTPVTSGSVIERSGLAKTVIRTRVGSPYVIESMLAAGSAARVLGFEANGGVLLGSPAARDGKILPALPTRDAFLPILSLLCLAAGNRKSIGEIIDEADVGFVLADRLKDTPSKLSSVFLSKLGEGYDAAEDFFRDAGGIAGMSSIDGLRFQLRDGSVIHYRASGNAPELRCYVEAPRQERGEELLAWGLQAAFRAMWPSQQRPT